jgi:hypothetical protein
LLYGSTQCGVVRACVGDAQRDVHVRQCRGVPMCIPLCALRSPMPAPSELAPKSVQARLAIVMPRDAEEAKGPAFQRVREFSVNLLASGSGRMNDQLHVLSPRFHPSMTTFKDFVVHCVSSHRDYARVAILLEWHCCTSNVAAVMRYGGASA